MYDEGPNLSQRNATLNNHKPWFSCSVIENKNMHILRSAAEPPPEDNGCFLTSNIKDLWNGRTTVFDVSRSSWGPPEDIQGRSWNEKEEESFIIRFSD